MYIRAKKGERRLLFMKIVGKTGGLKRSGRYIARGHVSD